MKNLDYLFFKFREKTPSDVSKCTESTEKILELHEDMAAVEGQEDQTADENDQGNSTKNDNFTKKKFISLISRVFLPRLFLIFWPAVCL